MRNNPTIKPGMSDETGLLITDRLNSLTAVMWAEKKPEVPMKDVNFYDYDGTVVYSYTKEEFLEMAELPANPAHARLSAQGWNWTIEAAQSYVTKYGSCEIGQSYITDDGRTRLYVRIGRTENFAVRLKFN